MKYFQIAKKLIDALHLTQPPVAITFSESLPDGIARPSKRVAAGCRFWQDATRQTFATIPADHAACSIGMYTHNLDRNEAQSADLGDALEIFGGLGYVTEADLPLIPVLPHRNQNVIYGPLADAVAEPTMALLFVDAAQALVVSEAAQQVENRFVPAMGRPACAVVPMVVNSDKSALSLGCCGARAYLDNFLPDTSLFAIPGNKLEQYTDRIVSLAAANHLLTRFHHLRKNQFSEGLTPSVKESLAAFKGE